MRLFKLSNLFHSKKTDYPLILVTGVTKTGTSAVYHSIREALPANAICLFEPEHRNLQLPGQIKMPVLVKSFIQASNLYEHFNRKILIVRDPRDRIISQMLYFPYNIVVKALISQVEKREMVLEEMMRLLHKKELDPGTVSVREIRALLNLHKQDNFVDTLINYYKSRPEIFIYKYEDYIDNKLEQLSKYLDLDVKTVGDVPEKRVVRSKSYGNWKDWFTVSDVDYYREIFNNYMKVFGYDDDWELNPSPKIDPAINSEYVGKLIMEAKSNKPL